MNNDIRFRGNHVNLFIHRWEDGTVRVSLIDETGYQIEKNLEVEEFDRLRDWAVSQDSPPI